MKKTSLQNPVKSCGYIKCYSSSSLRPIKSPSNSIRYNCLEDLQLTKKSQNHTAYQKNLAVHISLTFLNTGTTNETFQQFGKDSFRDILKNSATTYKSSNSQFLRTTTRIQSGSNAFDKSRLVMQFQISFRRGNR